MKVVYGHRLAGEKELFFIGSGSDRRAHVLDPTPSSWRAYVGERIADVEVEILERHACEGEARYREAELIGEHNPPANYIAAIRSATDMLTGRAKGATPCGCRRPDCRMAIWDGFTLEQQEAEKKRHRERVLRNKAARHPNQASPRPADVKQHRPAARPISGNASTPRKKQMTHMTPAMDRVLSEFLDAEAVGRRPEITGQQYGTAARALVATEGLSYEAALSRVRAAF